MTYDCKLYVFKIILICVSYSLGYFLFAKHNGVEKATFALQPYGSLRIALSHRIH